MDDDRTSQKSTYYPLTVETEEGVRYPGNVTFIHSFRIGRSEGCEVRCHDRSVSRVHLDVLFESGKWWLQDRQSRNGTFVDDEKIDRLCITDSCKVKLGNNGPMLSLLVENVFGTPDDFSIFSEIDSTVISNVPSHFPSDPSAPEPSRIRNRLGKVENPARVYEQKFGPGSVDVRNAVPVVSSTEGQPSSLAQERVNSCVEDLHDSKNPTPVKSFRFGQRKGQESATEIFRKVLREESDSDSEAGPSTGVIRIALEEAFHQRSRRYQMWLGGVGLLALVFGVVAWMQYLKVESLKDTATELFFTMKTMELGLAELESLVVGQLQPDRLKDMVDRRERLKAMQGQYEQFLDKIGVYSSEMSQEDRSIIRMARLFGECEIGMPPDFIKTVKSYIQKWQTTARLSKSIARAQKRGYGAKVSNILLAQNMPPQFFYLGLQESSLNPRAVGPSTRFGIAKGPWQFIPSTASEYGLQNGPLVAYEKYDPADERHNFNKATLAAAKYLKHIYTTEAQASGLLVMASYNWGQTRVRKLIRQLPETPRERNFWALLKRFNIPRETYDYVFYIFSAAVIGENPALFGFEFQNPLSDAEF